MAEDSRQSERLEDALLDRIIDYQVLIAWAGETQRLEWWRADATDLENHGGGEFFKRWLPNSGALAAIDAARRSAMLVDADARRAAVSTEDQDELITLFHLGSATDRQIEDRYRFRRTHRTMKVHQGEFNRQSLAGRLAVIADPPAIDTTPIGRRVCAPALPLDAAKVDALVLALLDGDGFPARYPVPYYDRRLAE